LKRVKLSEIAELNGGSTPRTKNEEYWNGGIVWLSPTDLPEIGEIVRVSDSERKITEEGLNSCSAKLLDPGTVIFSSRASIGKIAINEIPVSTNQGFINFTCSDEIDNMYLAYVLKYYTEDIVQLSNSTTFKEVSKRAIKDFKIPLPSLSEQKVIVAKLDRAQRLIDIDKEMLAKYDELIQSVFLEMFGDPVTNPKGFKKGTIRDIVSETKYGTNKKAHETEGEYPVIRMGNLLYNGDWDFSDMKYCDLEEKELPKYLVYKGDILFNRTNSKELVGKTGVYREDEPIAYAGYLIRVRPNEKATSEYISGYLNCPHGKLVLEHMCKNIVGMANINAQELQDIEILIPPIELQKDYERKVNIIRKKKSLIESEKKKSEELFSSLVQRVFGKE